jgi:hypothetical protein
MDAAAASVRHLPEVAAAKGSLKRLLLEPSEQFVEKLEKRVRVVNDLNRLAYQLIQLHLVHAFHAGKPLDHFYVDQEAVLAAYDVLHNQTRFALVKKLRRKKWIEWLRPLCENEYEVFLRSVMLEICRLAAE